MPSGSFHKQLSPTAAVGKRMGSSDNKMPTGKEHLRLQPLDHSDFATLEKGHRVGVNASSFIFIEIPSSSKELYKTFF